MIFKHILIACGVLAMLSASALAGTTPSHDPNSVARPTGNPAQGGQPNAHGYFENMTPVAHDDAEHAGHEPTHPVGGGGKAPAARGSAVQQQQPAAPAK